MRKIILLLLLLSGTTHFTRAQLLKKLGNQVNNALSGNNNNSDSSGHLKHHPKGNLVSNLGRMVGRNTGSGNRTDSSLNLSKEDEVKPTHSDLSKFNPLHYYKLQEGEKFTFYEACLLMQADKLNPQILVVKAGKPWLIGKDGQHIAVDPKKIPACPLNTRRGEVVPLNSLNGDQSEAYGDKPAIFSVKPLSDQEIFNDMGFDTAVLKKMQKYKDEGNNAAAAQLINSKMLKNKELTGFKPTMTIVFRGKTFGPYMQVKSYVFNRGAAKFLALVDFRRPNTDLTTMKGDIRNLMEPWLVGSDGTKIKLPDGADKIIADEDLNFIRVLVVKITPNNISDIHTFLFDPKTGKSIQILTNQSSINNPETEQSIDIKSGNLITKQHNGQQAKFYINDKLVSTLEGESDIPLPNVFVSKDASRWAIWGTKAMYFPNGGTVDGVISTRVGNENNLDSLNWIVLGNDNQTLEICHYEL